MVIVGKQNSGDKPCLDEAFGGREGEREAEFHNQDSSESFKTSEAASLGEVEPH